MSDQFHRFDSSLPRVVDTLRYPPPEPIERIYVIRDLYGKVRLAVSDRLENRPAATLFLREEATHLHERLGVRSYPPEDAVLFLDDELVQELQNSGRKILPHVYLVDRLLTGSGWWTVSEGEEDTPTYTLYSMKGGVGRSTTAAVLAWHWTQRGERVLVVDLDLESPGLSSAMLHPSAQPEYGVVDWFVEDLVGQGDRVLEDMIARPSWHQDFRGDVCIVPAHGRNPSEYLAKLGRVYLDTDVRWTQRLQRMLCRLRQLLKPTIVLLESRSGLHDIAAATMTDLNAHVLLFGTDSDTNWQDYGILFAHWQDLGLARDIRERLSIVSSLTPDVSTDEYLEHFRERSWTLFQDHVYDHVESKAEPDDFTFDLDEDDAPHDPIPIHWTRGLAAGASLRDFERTTVAQAYSQFLARVDRLVHATGGRSP